MAADKNQNSPKGHINTKGIYMEFLKEFFENKDTLKDYNGFSNWVKENGLNIADLSKGEYVSKLRHENETKKIIADYEVKMKAYENDFTEYDKLIKNHEEARLQIAQLQSDNLAANESVKKEKFLNLYMKNSGNLDYAELAVEKLMRFELEPLEAIQKFKEESPVYFVKPEIQTISTAQDFKGGVNTLSDSDREIAAFRKAASLPQLN